MRIQILILGFEGLKTCFKIDMSYSTDTAIKTGNV